MMGRPRDPDLEWLREKHPSWSERTIARYAAALRKMVRAGVPDDSVRRAIGTATRPNGSVNVSALDRRASALSALSRKLRGDAP